MSTPVKKNKKETNISKNLLVKKYQKHKKSKKHVYIMHCALTVFYTPND